MNTNNVPSRWTHSWLNDFEEVFKPFFVKPLISAENRKFFHSDAPYDVKETDEYYRLSLDVPGINPKNIHLKVQEHTLFVSAEEETENKAMRQSRSLNTSFSLPVHIDSSKIEANVENGVMDIILPKKKEAQLKEIPVQLNSSSGFLEKVKKQFSKSSH